MATALKDLRILRIAEDIADSVGKKGTTDWNEFVRDVMGKQITNHPVKEPAPAYSTNQFPEDFLSSDGLAWLANDMPHQSPISNL